MAGGRSVRRLTQHLREQLLQGRLLPLGCSSSSGSFDDEFFLRNWTNRCELMFVPQQSVGDIIIIIIMIIIIIIIMCQRCLPATGHAERVHKMCGCARKSAEHYFGQRKYGEHTIVLIRSQSLVRSTAEKHNTSARMHNASALGAKVLGCEVLA